MKRVRYTYEQQRSTLRTFNRVILILWLVGGFIMVMLSLSGGDLPARELIPFIFICLSVVFVLPIFVVVNVILRIVLYFTASQVSVDVTNKPDTLAQFIRDALTVIDDNSAGGRSEAEVTSLCQRAGWSDTEIQDARRTGCIKQQATKKLSTGGVHLSAKAAVRDAFRGLIRWVDRWFIR
jgi:hypothetical protein